MVDKSKRCILCGGPPLPDGIRYPKGAHLFNGVYLPNRIDESHDDAA